MWLIPKVAQKDLHWIAGLLEGEGSFLFPSPSNPSTPTISLESTDRDVVERAAHILGLTTVFVRPPRNNAKETHIIRMHGKRAIAWMERLLPLMASRRGARILEILDYMKRHNSCRKRRKAKDL